MNAAAVAARRDAIRVDVFWLELNVRDDVVHRLSRLLSDDERVRAGAFAFPHLTVRFTAARAALRMILAERLSTRPEQIVFEYGQYGRPELGGRFADAALRFNASHTEDVGVIAVTDGARIGVDVERVRELREMDAIAARVFSTRERAALVAMPASLRSRAFFDCWTRKEAFIKAIGEGLSYPLDRFSVTLAADEPARFIEIGGDPAAAAAWALRSLECPSGYAAALACEAERPHITAAPFALDTP